MLVVGNGLLYWQLKTRMYSVKQKMNNPFSGRRLLIELPHPIG